MSTPKFAETHNLVAFLEKPEESNGFEEIIDFLNTSSVQYALMVNPTIYTTYIEQFWTFAKVKTVNGERQIQALYTRRRYSSLNKYKIDLKLDDAEGTECPDPLLSFCKIERMGKNNTCFYKNIFSSQSQLLQVKDKGKGKMVEPEVPLKKKDQVSLDEEMARNLEAQLRAKLIEEERLARKKEEEANIALIESWDNT
ncbi:hypothetical protein Tco_1120367 [Tanacetum coccineum]